MRRRAPASILDLLVPARTYTAATRTRPTRPSLFPTTARHAPPSAKTPHPPLRRPFSTSPLRNATLAIFNPQTDEDGKEMVLEITEKAAKRLSEIMTKDANPHLALRIQVESGGCHGFQYLMKLVTLPDALPTGESLAAEEEGAGDSGEGIRADDTVFVWAQDGAEAEAGSSGLTAPKIILDGPSLELLKGSKVDFTMELIGSQFKIVDNPLATSSCGCGTSFDIKV